MRTVYGEIASRDGTAWDRVLEQGPDRPELRMRAWATDAQDFASYQGDERIPVLAEHGGPQVGAIFFLQRDANGLQGVAHVSDDVCPPVTRVRVGDELVVVDDDRPWYWSPETLRDEDGSIYLHAVAFTRRPARIAPRALAFRDGPVDHRGTWGGNELLQRAGAGYWHQALTVHDDEPRYDDPARPSGQLRIRTATQLDVSPAQRVIELIVSPYEQPTLVPHQGRMITEVIARGAYAGIEHETRRVKVNRDHDVTRVVGRAVGLYPDEPEGLVAELKIAKTALGDETLTLAEDGILDASAGFLPMPGGETWETRNRCRVTKAWLGHIALTPDPAYAGAQVLSVRGGTAVR
jgi:HK97 family phage prohead protease